MKASPVADEVPVSSEQRARHPIALLADPAALPVFRPKRGDGLVRWGLIGAFFFLYLLNCGSFGLWDPWETHYGEVARNMLESYDWVNPWWGYKTKIGSEAVAGKWFYSKPIYIFWATVSFTKLIGMSDWAFRLPIALLGATMVATVFLVVERVADRRHAVIAAAVTGLSPFVYMVSRQAQTDLPFVATMTIGMCLVALALFGKRQQLSDGAFVRWLIGFLLFVAANLIPQWAIVATDLSNPDAGALFKGLQAIGAMVQHNGIFHVAIYGTITLILLVSLLWPIWRQRRLPEGWDDGFKDRQQRRMILLSAYMMFAQATYAKGLLGFMLPGAILVAWLAVTGAWRVLARLDLLRGIPLFLLTGLPWYVAMFCRHGRAYYNRFFVHDHFNRVGSGVHQIDSGTFEHFIKWLGYGLFPWAAFVPLAIVALVRPKRIDPVSGERLGLQPIEVLLGCWFAVSFAVFTVSSTKFHHYIMPAVPALTMLVAFYLVALSRLPAARVRLHVLLALGFFAVLVINLLGDVQNLRNLFTYKYDRPLPANLPLDWAATVRWPTDVHPIVTWADTRFAAHVGPMVANILEIKWFRYETFIPIIGISGGMGLLAMLFRRLRGLGLATIAATAALLAFWALNFYMPMLTPHWSQRYIFEAYYEDCSPHPNPPAIEEAYTPLLRQAGLDGIADFFDSRSKRVCKEDIISWLITWRGETFYSNNEIRPINKEAKQFLPYLRDFNNARTFYVLMERGRTNGFASKLRQQSRTLKGQKASGWVDIDDWKVEVIANDSAFFVLARCVPMRGNQRAANKAAAPSPATKTAAPSASGSAGAAPIRGVLSRLAVTPSGRRPARVAPIKGNAP